MSGSAQIELRGKGVPDSAEIPEDTRHDTTTYCAFCRTARELIPFVKGDKWRVIPT